MNVMANLSPGDLREFSGDLEPGEIDSGTQEKAKIQDLVQAVWHFLRVRGISA